MLIRSRLRSKKQAVPSRSSNLGEPRSVGFIQWDVNARPVALVSTLHAVVLPFWGGATVQFCECYPLILTFRRVLLRAGCYGFGAITQVSVFIELVGTFSSA